MGKFYGPFGLLVADTFGMPRNSLPALRHLTKLALVGVLMLSGGCTYFWVDPSKPAPTPPWTPLAPTSSTSVGPSYNVGAVHCDPPTPPQDMGSFTRSTVLCWQDRAHDETTTTTTGRHFYWYVYRHYNDFGGVISQCDNTYWADVLGDDQQSPAPWNVPLGQWVTTYGWTTADPAGMHGCGGHGPGWTRHMEQRLIVDVRETTSTANKVRVPEPATLVSKTNIDQPKVVPT